MFTGCFQPTLELFMSLLHTAFASQPNIPGWFMPCCFELNTLMEKIQSSFKCGGIREGEGDLERERGGQEGV